MTWTTGKSGKRIVNVLQKLGIKITYYADSQLVSEDMNIDGIPVVQSDQVFCKYKVAKVVLGSVYHTEMNKKINDMNYQWLIGNVYFLPVKKYILERKDNVDEERYN